MKRCITFVFALSLFAISSIAKERHYIYMFDCTQSMEKDFNIWKPAKKWLRTDIERKREDALITIMPFRDNCDGGIPSFYRRNLEWNRLESRFDELIATRHSKTGICRAWDEAVKLIKPGYENWFIVLTDGEDGYDGSDEVKRRMHEWCKFYHGTHGYVVTLSKTAKDALWTDISNCEDIDIIDGTGFIPILGSFVKVPMSMLANDPKNFSIGFSEEGKFMAHVECNDPFYEVSLNSNLIENEEAVIIVKEKKKGVKPQSNHYIDFSIISDEQGVQFIKPSFSIFVDPRDLSNVNIRQSVGEDYNGGSVKTYPSFVFFPGKESDVVDVDLGVVFNEAAKQMGGCLHFRISMPNELLGNCELLYNGKPVLDSFDITSVDNSSIVTVSINHEAQEGIHMISLLGTSDNLETINANMTDTYNTRIRVKHIVKCNPVAIFLFWVFILFGVFTSFMFIWKNLLTRRIMDKQICLVPDYYNPIAEVNNCVKCILTNKHENGRNGLVHRIYCGPIQYVNIPDALSDIILVTNYDEDIIAKANISYDLNNIPLTSNQHVVLNCKNKFELRDRDINFTVIIS